MARLLYSLILLKVGRQNGFINDVHGRMRVLCLDGNRLLVLENSDTNWTFVRGEHTSNNIALSIVLACAISRELMLSLRPASHGSQPGRKRRGCGIVLVFSLLDLASLWCLSSVTFWRLGGIFVCDLAIGPSWFSFRAEGPTVLQLGFGRRHLFAGPVFDNPDGVRANMHSAKGILSLLDRTKIIGLRNISHMLVKFFDLRVPWAVFSHRW